MAVAEPTGCYHLLPSLDPLSGLHGYVRSLGIPDCQLISPDPALHLPPGCRTLVLHFSGYGYARNGAPAALVEACIAWRKSDSQRRLLVVFHELFTRQPPWRKGFWWASRQRSVLHRLAQAADAGLSTLERHSAWLRGQGFAPYATVAVPSNVGEHPEPPDWSQRQRILLVFGGTAQRQRAYAALRRCGPALEALAIDTIHDVGPPLPAPPRTALPLMRHGQLPAPQVADLLASAALGAVAYPHSFLAKSGIFAALCAHGCTPLVLHAGRSRMPEPDGLRSGQEFLTPDRLGQLGERHGPAAAGRTAARIATAAWCWYQPHRLEEQRRLFRSWIARNS